MRGDRAVRAEAEQAPAVSVQAVPEHDVSDGVKPQKFTAHVHFYSLPSSERVAVNCDTKQKNVSWSVFAESTKHRTVFFFDLTENELFDAFSCHSWVKEFKCDSTFAKTSE